MSQLAGRSAILTGASRGIGPHIARALAHEGVHLALVARASAELEGLAREIAATGVRAVPIAADLATPASREALVTRAGEELGAVDILINNAGGHHGGRLHTRTAAQVEEIAQLNLVAPIELTRRLLPAMLDRGTGHVVHVASLAGKVPMPYFSVYSATKHGLVGFNHALQAELRGTGVRSSAVCPGFVAGEGMWARLGGAVHPALQVSQPRRVAQAVVDAIKHDRMEQVVNPLPVRPVIALWALAPSVGATVFRWLRVDRFVRRAAEQAERGSPANGRPQSS